MNTEHELVFALSYPVQVSVAGMTTAFMVLLALINLRGVGESVKFNVILTMIELLALAIVIVIGFVAIVSGDGDLSRITVFESPDDKGLFMAVTIATAIATHTAWATSSERGSPHNLHGTPSRRTTGWRWSPKMR